MLGILSNIIKPFRVCSEKLDVEDHYVAWRQAHDSPQHSFGAESPFSFCSFPFLLSPRAKSKLLHTEARFLMTQVSFAWPESQLQEWHKSSLSGLSQCVLVGNVDLQEKGKGAAQALSACL